MIPLSVENRNVRVPWMTMLILGVTFAVWIFVQGGGFPTDPRMLATTVCNYGMVPGEITHLARLGTAVPIGPGLDCVVDNDAINYLTPLLSIFLHGGWMHILGNALFLWIFGRAIEDVMGPMRFLGFYLLCGLAAAAAQIIVTPSSPVPTVGASGAISGVMGAYLLLFPRVRVHMFFFFFLIFRIPAWIVLLYWFAIQVLTGLPELNAVGDGPTGGVAVWAHVGGFMTGLLLVRFFERPDLLSRRRVAFGAYG
ncbi:MAG TPA: rhomboid family intramembrane serine protease [Gemmatimonadaceae bacterium]|nr:rhomboid family intramembrane serine protease [Gemmatimonadaceae bacterium]